MKISITSPVSGKQFCIYDYLQGVKKIINANPDIEWSWVVCDTSEDSSIKARIDDLGISCIYTTFPKGVDYKDYTTGKLNSDMLAYMPRLYNHIMSLVPDCDYVLNIEDDIVCEQDNPVPYMLKGFKEDVAAVVGVTFVRRIGERFGQLQGNCALKELLSTGYMQMNTTAFGFIMMKTEYAKMPYDTKWTLAKAFDPAFGERMCTLGKKLMMCFDVTTKHFFKDEHDMVKYVSKDNNCKILKQPLVPKMWPRKTSPLFVSIPQDIELTEEMVGIHLMGVPLY